MPINFTDSPANGATTTQGNSTFIYNSTYGVWDRVISTSAISTYSTLANMPLSGVEDDTLAKVLDTNKLYKWTGTGWYFLDPVNNNPTITTAGDATYALASDGTPTVVTLEANDPEGFPITWNYAVTVGSLGSTATVAQSNNVFTITPSTDSEDAGDFTLTFTASDGVNLATSASEFSLSFVPSWSLATQQAKLLASDAQGYDQFGYSVSISGDGNTAIVGADGEDTGAAGGGAAYIFTRSGSTWTEQAKLLASDAGVYDYFGQSVSISNDGNTAIVGCYGDDTGATGGGAAYIFTRSGSTWTEEAKIQASDPEENDFFGIIVSLSGDGNTAIAGTYYKDTGGTDTGAAYIFARSGSTWTQQAKIQSSDIQAYDNFCRSLSLSSDGNTAIVGANNEDTGGTNAGAAYIFTRSGSTWTEQAKIQSSDVQARDSIGGSVSISGDGNTIIVGASGEDTVASAAGAAYIFTRSGSTWTEEAKIQASDAEASDQFGWAVSISNDGNTVIVGALLEDAGGSNAGAAYIFTRSDSTWTQQAKLLASDADVDDWFGRTVSLSGDGTTAIVGAHYEGTGGIKAGSAYIFVPG